MWVKVSDLAALPAPELERHLRRSYDLVVAGLPKKTDLLSRSRFRLSKNQSG
jgi:predicted DNA-binding protein (MmcQ/YjbR family)